LFELFGPAVDIGLLAAGLSIVMRLVQNKFVNRKQMKVRQAEMKKKQKRIKELAQRGDDKSKGEMMELQKEMMADMNEMMQGSMKSMMYTMVLIIPLWWFFGSNYAEVSINLPFAIPFWAAFDWFNPGSWVTFKMFETTNWIGWYVLISLIVSIVFSVALKIYDKVKG
jgi:uncharacterized membrane protein (DUF106 family)